ncbi:hypothetical protein [Leptospira yasudae]|uniref:Hemerythrin-like domain-containing protein n=1 Tax=Leptospira yasudae TaxID=2202201 RepID=A0A6N4QLN0_9LEPT|nr:hypothetical protein [Leptospira yasudae]TGL76444.1 hypothetical protein EHQ77_18825 [Leptospira yasudae]TGL83367.1 hypothetical protein EHQ72_02740 [Leptospira yasudae]TGL89485.1 hypothetical protein EHQ83_01790 [Leptospira yasudae]
MQTEAYKKQNEVLQRLVIELIRILRSDSITDRVNEVLDILATLNAKLSEHMMTESNLILMEEIPEEILSEEQFDFCTKSARNELRSRVRTYVTMWSLPSLILEKPSHFIKDSNELMDLLYIRIQNEIELLIPLLNGSYAVQERIG